MKIKFKNHIIYVDKEDFHFLESHNWYIHKSNTKLYLRGYLKGHRKNGLVYLHRLILNGSEIDHIDGNGLNNERKNLRVCDRTHNNGNRVDYGSKGVHYDSLTKKYRAMIWFKGKKYCLGRFSNFEEAKIAYNKKSKELFKEFSNTQ